MTPTKLHEGTNKNNLRCRLKDSGEVVYFLFYRACKCNLATVRSFKEDSPETNFWLVYESNGASTFRNITQIDLSEQTINALNPKLKEIP